MAREPNPAIFEAVGQGRAGRGASNPDAWVHLRALALTLASEGLKRRRVGAALGVRGSDVPLILAEACHAVLQSKTDGEEADAVCYARWERWCIHRDNRAACDRVRRLSTQAFAERRDGGHSDRATVLGPRRQRILKRDLRAPNPLGDKAP